MSEKGDQFGLNSIKSRFSRVGNKQNPLLFRISFSNKTNLKSHCLNTINVYVLLMQIQNKSMVLEVEGSSPHCHPQTQTPPSGIQGCHGREIKAQRTHTCSSVHCSRSDTCYFPLKPLARTCHMNPPNTGIRTFINLDCKFQPVLTRVRVGCMGHHNRGNLSTGQ